MFHWDKLILFEVTWKQFCFRSKNVTWTNLDSFALILHSLNHLKAVNWFFWRLDDASFGLKAVDKIAVKQVKKYSRSSPTVNTYFLTFNKTLFKISFSFNFGFHRRTSEIKIKSIFRFLMKFYMKLTSILHILNLRFISSVIFVNWSKMNGNDF